MSRSIMGHHWVRKGTHRLLVDGVRGASEVSGVRKGVKGSVLEDQGVRVSRGVRGGGLGAARGRGGLTHYFSGWCFY